ncbi:acetyl-CoA carboxylase, carboxyltransferase subunit beta [Ornithobacterium rhinotracheale]|uniref:Acetyl-coenzyme A carboxylase carboxyl transferase subunit beta n=1 Tax=Ornithobacterium rhinotracheale (strain ATCC 51463 / DSM 15997 / CCUG 23171 / CIP 104009 / LMG 9086) TaxID=867902 RepID=I4A069_ORNRL|nr:acetyl-CoA carboxylase, carboxyltransferase subunit beta [Ornithobacterium rhinotracheale]AFL97353.1 acetyl-CoA carboxylase, carboxyl transferase, beta subunit [Ornithobacterium rhinotracheale DSM 15997]AIP99038.1 acetyl-CoA carboxylase carboxyl transferase subunit beta [Ornithobacterium rhinotracheale ORT-UMN 88]KGB66960.1 acetyl-CoA carboxylase carboxyl transferase subunit beta [Ornithobacterium rhinotracheale H06-030791]MBN3662020.1 acetyl-CoA carboxylase carboxyltransferase subunit beta 
MAWFRRTKKNIQTTTEEKKDTPKGLWYKTPTGKVIETEELERNDYVSPEDDFHVRIGSQQYFEILFDDKKFKELDKNLSSKDPLGWEDTQKYTDRVKSTRKKTGLTDSLRTAYGDINGRKVVVSAMDFVFIGGSLGSVMGEKIVRAIDYAIKNNTAFVLICKSGGARMMEAAHSLMQMAKVEAKLVQLSEAKLPYITILTDPTFGGITASFGMMGDVTIAEPGALIGFAGPRVIKETIGKDLPEGFQTSEFLLEKGFVDLIVHRQSLKTRLTQLLDLMMEK